MAHAICKFLWMKLLLSDLGFPIRGPMHLYYDNKAIISIAHNPVQHERTKHIEVDCHFIRHKLMSGQICIPFVKINEKLADLLTKGLGSSMFKCFSPWLANWVSALSTH